jgi:hypothetical protein
MLESTGHPHCDDRHLVLLAAGPRRRRSGASFATACRCATTHRSAPWSSSSAMTTTESRRTARPCTRAFSSTATGTATRGSSTRSATTSSARATGEVREGLGRHGIESWVRGSRYRGQYRQGLRHDQGSAASR